MRGQQGMNLGEAFGKAMAAYEGGRAGEARRLARQLVEAAPAFGGAHYLLGLLDLDQGKPKLAAEHLARAIAITPGQSVLHLAMGRALEQSGDIHSAGLHYRTVLEREPSHAEAHARLGELLGRAGKLDEAIDHCRKATAANPGHVEALNTLGALLQQAGRPAEAADPLARALAIRPDWAVALNNYGVTLKELGRLEEAATILAGAVELRPRHAGSRANLAGALRLAGRLEEARLQAERATKAESGCAAAWLELGLVRKALGGTEGAAAAFDRAVGAAPDQPHGWFCLAEARLALGQKERAAQAFRKCLELDPEDRHGAQLGLALAGAAPMPGKAPEAYVRQLFDDYAETFDRALVDKLDYRAPALLAEAMARALGPVTELDVLDAGCGTGLAAPVLRPLAARLDGVDLSAGMVEKARQRGLYDGLAVGELVATLLSRPAAYDLVVAADVLVYLGELEPVMAAAAAALKPGGAFAFTVERTEQAASYALGPKQRYAHAPAYVRAEAEAAGFRVELMEDAVTRREAGQDVPGLVAVARR